MLQLCYPMISHADYAGTASNHEPERCLWCAKGLLDHHVSALTGSRLTLQQHLLASSKGRLWPHGHSNSIGQAIAAFHWQVVADYLRVSARFASPSSIRARASLPWRMSCKRSAVDTNTAVVLKHAPFNICGPLPWRPQNF